MIRVPLLGTVVLSTLLSPLAGAGCAADGCKSERDGERAANGAGVGGTGGTAFGRGGSGGLGMVVGAGGSTLCTPGGPDDDMDGDGYTPNDGDCHDCDKNVNPNAIEVPTEDGNDVSDEDCDGEEDEDDESLCDTGLAIDEVDPMIAARALELCKVSAGPGDWGVVSAKWTLADGSAPPVGYEQEFHIGHGILPSFGAKVKVRKGQNMLALSSGTARQPDDPGYQDLEGFAKGFLGAPPLGFPKESAACPGVITGPPFDAAGLEVVIRTPANAHGFTFDLDFFTYEWPDYVCSEYNDFFVTLLMPFPQNQADGNISFDKAHNPISVNNALLEVCGCAGNPPNPCVAKSKSFTCSLGDTDLTGTGFGPDFGGDTHGSTAWLQTKAPVEPASEITVRFAVYDSGDGYLDTTTLVDNFEWTADPGTKVGTIPVPD